MCRRATARSRRRKHAPARRRVSARAMSDRATRFRSLVEPGRFHRSLYTDPAIFALEMERIFGRMWIYVGHESQVKAPGDFLATRIGVKPVLMVRHEDGRIYVIHNQCAHRGAMVV